MCFLPKIQQRALDTTPRVLRWLWFLSLETSAQLEALVKGDPVMEKALTTLEFLSHDEETRLLYEARQKALHDYASAIANAEEKGLEKGRKEGRDEGRKEGRDEGRKEGVAEVATKLLAKGATPAEVAEVTGLSEAEIDAIRQRLQ